MKKIIYLVFFIFLLGIYFNTNAWNTNFTSEDKKYCSLLVDLNSTYEGLSRESLLKKYSSVINPIYRESLIEQEQTSAQSTITFLSNLINKMISKDSNLYWLDCYQFEHSNKDLLNWIKITEIWPKKLFSDSKIIIKWIWFWDKLTSDSKLYLWYSNYKYEIKGYYEYSDNKMILAVPDSIKPIINEFEHYYFKLCKGDKCIYSDIIDWKVTNDPHSHMQYYLNKHNIIDARKSINTPKKVKIAIIDDGISVNHLDLTNNIWVNLEEIPWNWIDDDSNWYIDDYNSWNFIYNWNNIKPLWNHGTKVAWVIWAETNNEEWISWILNNVELMSIGVCDEKWCKTEDIVKWIKYAVDNWANIINLSLWWHQFSWYNQSYDEALKYAYEKDIIVVIAWGNWDVLSSKISWVNTKINKLSPICNYWDNYKNIFWVWSQNMSWTKSNWSNYWNCIDFYTMWKVIFSTSFLETESSFWEDYISSDWTSFSAPILAWIIWLWYEKYWKVDRIIVYDSLKESINGWIIDANKYLEILWSKLVKENEIEKVEIVKAEIVTTEIKVVIVDEIDERSKKVIDNLFIKLEKRLWEKSKENQKIIYTNISDKIDILLNKRLSKKNILILSYLKELITDKLLEIDLEPLIESLKK